MKERRRILDHLSEAADLQDEAIPGLPLIEIMGDRRVLIEHHCGVTEYGCEQISVKVKQGSVCIYGSKLELALMTKEQLIICGFIEGVKLIRRGK